MRRSAIIRAQTLTRKKTAVSMNVCIDLAFESWPPERPRRLAWPRTSPFHGGNAGSNPAGDAKKRKELRNPAIPALFPGNAAVTIKTRFFGVLSPALSDLGGGQ